MANIESNVRPVLTRMLTGQSTLISPPDQYWLAMWAYKTLLTMFATRNAVERLPDSDYRAFRTLEVPLAPVWLGAVLQNGGPVALNRVRGLLWIPVIGPVVFGILHHLPDLVDVAFQVPPDAYDPIWPPFAPHLLWPPRVVTGWDEWMVKGMSFLDKTYPIAETTPNRQAY